MKSVQILILSALLVAGCKPLSTVQTAPEPDIWAIYQAAVEDAMVPTQAEISQSLIAIQPNSPDLIWREIEGESYVLLVTWTDYEYPKLNESTTYNTGDYHIWVTASSELQNRIGNKRYTDSHLRIAQLLGMPPNASMPYFVEFWVRPQDVFRPCPDAEIDDTACGLSFPEDADSTQITWINQLRIDSYYQPSVQDKYPWTQLGYTYDWSPESQDHIGLSEFVIDTGKEVYIQAVYTTVEYLEVGVR
ncbi:hypothetical protein [Pontibacter sp. G13]|uniref:hypothetical protein n=1 Tax=Pontibacter sp. G13 TaxID=3074898 RepID=UPI00288AF5A3|nr:hypothetical protein [Pontibacter sp. G13]WNJ19470.1 hypothetical protein RJD25_03165 [Pontibacter sp. G13]